MHIIQDGLRFALSSAFSLDAWNSEKDGRINLFARQIEAKAQEVTTNASALLDEFEQYSSSSPTLSFSTSSLDNDDGLQTPLGEFFFNFSVGESSWLQDIEKEVAIIDSFDIQAQKLSVIAIESFDKLKSDTTSVMETATLEATSLLETKTSEMYNKMQMNLDEKKQAHKNKPIYSIESPVNPLLFQDETWSLAGYQIEDIISPEIALETIKSLPLKTYKLKDDKQRDLGVNKDERRTRFHVGVIDSARETNEIKLEPSTIFSINIGGITQLAKSLEHLMSKLTVSSTFFHDKSSLNDKVTKLKHQTEAKGNSTTFKSPAQLASEVAALETKAALTRISRLSQSVIASTRINVIYSRFISQLKQQAMKSRSSERIGVVESDSVTSREIRAETAESYLDQLLVHFEAIDKMKNIWNSTKRELKEMNDAAEMESLIAKEEIHAEATVERENESSSLELIRLLGKARIDEIIQAIENIFWHLTRCFQHIMTAEGRQQFVFYAGSAAALVFVVSTLKELITLTCVCILRFFTAPRLVREYGNTLTSRAKWNTAQSSISDIVLPQDIKERMDIIVKTASAASIRRFPLRSVLIHGKPGSGKSLAANAIAQSIQTLPYALMSGADVFPMGKCYSILLCEFARLLQLTHTCC